MITEDPKDQVPTDNPPTDTPQDDPIAAMQKGIAQANEEDAAPLMPDVNPEPKADDPPPPSDEPAPDITPPPADEPAELDKEMDALGLKAKARERFASMAGEIAEFRPLREALKAAGVTDVSMLPEVIDKAKRADEFYAAVADTKAPPQEFAKSMDILKRFNSGDVTQINSAYDELLEVMRQWAPVLGRTVDGIDPFAAEPDLKQMVEDGAITQELALEVVKSRTAEKLAAAQAQTHTAEQQAQAEAEAEEQTARARLNELGAHLYKTDAQYKEKFAFLKPIVDGIMESLPPRAWPEAVAKAYGKIQLPPPPVVKPPNPARPQGQRPAVVPETNDPLEAMRYGIEQANAM